MYDMLPPQPVQMPQPPENKRMSVPQIMLIVLVVAFAAWYLITTLTPESSPYATITAGVIGSRYSGDCLIIRDESPFDAEAVSSVDYIAEEGSLVTRGVVVCNVYSSGFSTKEMTALQDYRNQIKDYQVKLLKAQVQTDAQMEKLEADVMTRAREVRELIGGARGNMNNQEMQLARAIQLRQARLKELYSKDQRMTRLYEDEQSQLQRISSWTKQFGAQGEGLVSFYSDGYEYGLTVTNYDKFSLAQVRAMINGQKPSTSEDALMKGRTTIYRMIKNGKWMVLMLIKDNTWNPVEGAVYDLKLENFTDTTVRATVTGFTRTGGELEVVLMVENDVEPILYVRSCTGVLGDSVASLTVPARAIYTQDNMPGVVVVDGDYQYFIPVNILDRKDGNVYIAPIQQGVLYEGETVRLF